MALHNFFQKGTNDYMLNIQKYVEQWYGKVIQVEPFFNQSTPPAGFQLADNQLLFADEMQAIIDVETVQGHSKFITDDYKIFDFKSDITTVDKAGENEFQHYNVFRYGLLRGIYENVNWQYTNAIGWIITYEPKKETEAYFIGESNLSFDLNALTYGDYLNDYMYLDFEIQNPDLSSPITLLETEAGNTVVLNPDYTIDVNGVIFNNLLVDLADGEKHLITLQLIDSYGGAQDSYLYVDNVLTSTKSIIFTGFLTWDDFWGTSLAIGTDYTGFLSYFTIYIEQIGYVLECEDIRNGKLYSTEFFDNGTPINIFNKMLP